MMSFGNSSNQEAGATATAVAPAKVVAKPRLLPLFRVILHNDDENTYEDVVKSIVMLTPLDMLQAFERMKEAHQNGMSLLLVTHKERAELYVEQFASCNLVVTIEPDD